MDPEVPLNRVVSNFQYVIKKLLLLFFLSSILDFFFSLNIKTRRKEDEKEQKSFADSPLEGRGVDKTTP